MTITAADIGHAVAGAVNSGAGNAALCLAIVAAAVAVYAYYHRRIVAILEDLEAAKSCLARVENASQFWIQIDDISRKITARRALAGPWKEFRKTLLVPPTRATAETRVLSTRSADEFFHEDAILGSTINTRLIAAVPSYLTGAGIFGTFVGLVAGIYLATSGLQGPPEEVHQALTRLLMGASVAFMTSIAGLGTSILFSWRERLLHRDLLVRLGAFNKRLDVFLTLITPESLLQDALGVARDQLDLQRQTRDDVRSLAAAAASLVEASTEQSASSASSRAEMAAMREQLTSIRESAQEQLTATREVLHEQRRELAALERLNSDMALAFSDSLATVASDQLLPAIRELRALLEQIRDRTKESDSALIHGVVDRFTDAISGAAGNEIQKLGETLRNVDGALSGHLSDLTHAHADVTERLVAAASNLTTATSRATEELTLASKETHDAMRVLAPLLRQAGEVSAGLAQRLDAATPLHQALIGIASEVTDAADRIATSNEFVADKWSEYSVRFENIDSGLARTFSELDEGLRQYQEEVARAMAELSSGVERISGTFAGAIGEFESSTEDLQHVLESIDRQVKDLLRRFGSGGAR